MQVHTDERVDDLQYKGYKLIQKKEGFRFGVDAVLLANFADIRKNDLVIDLGTGTGIIAVLIAAKTGARFVTGLEIQQDMAEMASRSVSMNDLDKRVQIVCGDIKSAVDRFGPSKFNAVVTNPPYISKNGGLLNPSDTKAVSRHEILCSLGDVIRNSAGLLVPGGRFSMVHKPERLADIIELMRHYSLEPKTLRLVHPSPGKRPNMVLVGGVRNGNPQLTVMEPLYVYDSEGNYSDEINEIYARQQKG